LNQLVLTALIAELGALRYTPAGLPAVDLVLQHESDVLEAGLSRSIKVAIKAVAFGSVAERIGQHSIGPQWRFSGFLANPRNGKHAVFHIQDFQNTLSSSLGVHHGRI
jgi:primosomal replication protein N